MGEGLGDPCAHPHATIVGLTPPLEGYHAVFEVKTGAPDLYTVITWALLSCPNCKETLVEPLVLPPFTERLIRVREHPGFVGIVGPLPGGDQKSGAQRLADEKRRAKENEIAQAVLARKGVIG